MSMLSSPNFLRNVLWADSVSCIGSGALQLLFAGMMVPMLGLPAQLLAATGIFLLVYGAAVAFLATRNPVPRTIVWVLVAGNLAWAIGCVALLVSGLLPLTAAGKAYVLVQALTVAVLAELQWMALRKAPAGWA
ncbi:MAG: hypothetical protein EOO28_34505 [Comamonadaceae bacterium]|nr:MAG: hypothetical protein EOO28_34505 [Comamonadaceae bacterium]